MVSVTNLNTISAYENARGYDNAMTLVNSDLPGLELGQETLFERLTAGHTLVTGNSRLSRVLGQQYIQWRGLSERQWQSPTILSWTLWLDKLWEAASLQGVEGCDRAVPGSRQLLSLWESTLIDEPVKHNLLHPESLASQLSDTRRLMTEWQLDFADREWFEGENENYLAFYLWNKAFETRCKQGNWIPPEDRAALLIDAINGSQLAAPTTIDLLGFDEFNPLQSDLLQALQDNGSTVTQLTITPNQPGATSWKSKDSNDELQHMARWARYWIEQEPTSSIAIVVHELQNRRQEIERHLTETLTPGIEAERQEARPWNISMGTPLVRVPMIEAAFDLLKLLADRIDIQDVGRVLKSPWIRGADDERNSRALLEKCLREKYPRQLKLGQLQYRADEIKEFDRQGNELPPEQQLPQAWNSPELSRVITSLSRFKFDNRGKRKASAWADQLEQLLRGLGWPLLQQGNPEGEAATTDEHNNNWQALQAWQDCLRELASLDTTTAVMSRQTASRQLRQICRDKIFQPRTATAPIQVLGIYEVSGLRFDHLWVVGLHNDNWPASARPNAFIPGKLQRSAQIPNSSPKRELEVARKITQRLLETASDCIFSYPGQVDTEEVLPSPLLSNTKPIETTDLPGYMGDSWQRVVANADQPRLDGLQMPGKLDHDTARGGSSILKNQALCPFRAFASNRLGAEGLETPVDGISAMLHGSLLHSVLEYFWKQTRTHAALQAMDDTAVEQRVSEHVETVVNEQKGLNQRPAFRDVEARRLRRHVMDYLQLERRREAFEVVGFEREIHPEIEGQSIRLFIDRVDKLPGGEEIIIDYKTGKVEPKKWFGERPEDPQLPLYALSADKTPAAVVFGIVREDGCLYKGVVQRGGLLPDLPPNETKYTRELVEAGQDMPGTIDNWREVVHRLMAGFLAGEALIDPKDGLKTCDNSYCELQSLCRVNELLQAKKAGQQAGHPA